MLKKAAAEAEGQPAKQGAIQERIRVCEKALAALKNDPNAAATANPATPDRRGPQAAPGPQARRDLRHRDQGPRAISNTTRKRAATSPPT